MANLQQIIPALTAAFPTTPVRTLHAEQINDLQAADVPLVVVEPDGTSFGEYDGFCMSGESGDSLYTISFYALGLEEAWRMADVARPVMVRQLNATIQSQIPVWEPFIKVHRVSQVYEMYEDNPSIV